jgi:hypothetical protein
VSRSERGVSRRVLPGGRDRRHATPARPHAVLVRCTAEEYRALVDAAKASGLTPTGYAAEAAIAAARGGLPPAASPEREALFELMTARPQVRRFGNNVNQAVRELHLSGELPAWLQAAVALTARAVERLDAAAAVLAGPRRTSKQPPSERLGRVGRSAASSVTRPSVCGAHRIRTPSRGLTPAAGLLGTGPRDGRLEPWARHRLHRTGGLTSAGGRRRPREGALWGH